jgi:cupin fold WbuC family metalloprotein
MIKIVTTTDLADLTLKAAESSRQRLNLNIHQSGEALVQRLFLAIEPDSYIRPHRHPQAHKWELFVFLAGEIDVLIFDDAGEIVQREELNALATRAVELPPNTWHSYVSYVSGSLAIEIKEGAFIPATADGTPAAKDFLIAMKKPLTKNL